MHSRVCESYPTSSYLLLKSLFSKTIQTAETYILLNPKRLFQISSRQRTVHTADSTHYTPAYPLVSPSSPDGDTGAAASSPPSLTGSASPSSPPSAPPPPPPLMPSSGNIAFCSRTFCSSVENSGRCVGGWGMCVVRGGRAGRSEVERVRAGGERVRPTSSGAPAGRKGVDGGQR